MLLFSWQQEWDEISSLDSFTLVPHVYLSRLVSMRGAVSRENCSPGFPTRLDTNRTVESQNKTRCLKFRIQVVEELYYLCSKNKGADQLCSYCTADLRLCFRMGKHSVFSWRGSGNVFAIEHDAISELLFRPKIVVFGFFCFFFLEHDALIEIWSAMRENPSSKLISAFVFATRIVL